MSQINTQSTAGTAKPTTDVVDYEVIAGTDAGDETPQIVQPFRLAKTAAARSLSNQLQDKFGMTEAAADAIAYAVEDPAEARRQLPFPSRVRVPGGTLQTITARVSALSVTPHLLNGRVVGATAYPAAVHNGAAPAKFWAERDLTMAGNGTAELVLNGSTRQQVVDALEIAARELLAQNDLTYSIREHGIFFPVTVVPIHVRTDEGEETKLSAVEGSSRTASAHRILGISSSDPLYGGIADPRVARSRMQELMSKLDLPLEEVTQIDLERARAASFPAIIIVGYEPDISGATLLDALDAYVAFLHLDPPLEWSEPAKENKLADGVVDVLLEHKLLTQTEAEWFAGMLPPTEAVTNGLPSTPDERAAHILRKLSAPSHTPTGKAVGIGVKRYTLKERARSGGKALAAASLALRSFSSSRKKATTTILGKAWEYAGFWNHDWDATSRTLEELRNAALVEVEQGGTPGPATLELAARASYYLVTAEVLAAPEPGSNVGNRAADKRYANTVLGEIVRSTRGVHVLFEAANRGRMNLRPPKVNERGTVVVSAAGSAIEADKKWLRDTFPASKTTSITPPLAAITPTMTPEHLLDITVDDFESDIDNVVARMKSIEAVQAEDGSSLVAKVGVDAPRAHNLRARLEAISQKLTKYELIWQMANADLVDGEDTDEVEE